LADVRTCPTGNELSNFFAAPRQIARRCPLLLNAVSLSDWLSMSPGRFSSDRPTSRHLQPLDLIIAIDYFEGNQTKGPHD